MLAAVVAALASCQSKANKAAEAEADSLFYRNGSDHRSDRSL